MSTYSACRDIAVSDWWASVAIPWKTLDVDLIQNWSVLDVYILRFGRILPLACLFNKTRKKLRYTGITKWQKLQIQKFSFLTHCTHYPIICNSLVSATSQLLVTWNVHLKLWRYIFCLDIDLGPIARRWPSCGGRGDKPLRVKKS